MANDYPDQASDSKLVRVDEQKLESGPTATRRTALKAAWTVPALLALGSIPAFASSTSPGVPTNGSDPTPPELD